jgi:hypothetical protein
MSDAAAPDAIKTFHAKKLAIADRIRHDGRLSASIRIIGAEICSLTNFRTGYSWAPEKYLAEKLSVTDRTIKRAIVALKAAGWIAVERVGRSNRYRPIFAALEQGTICPLLEPQQGTICHPSDADRGQNRPQKGTISTGNRGQKGPPISLEISLGISARAETAPAVGAPDGAAGHGEFDLGLPGAALLQRLGDDVFRSWLGKVAVVEISGDEVVLSAPTSFLADYIAANFEAAIVACWRLQHPSVSRLRMTVAARVTPISTRRKPAENADARWLVDVGVGLVAERLHATRASADKTVVAWLRRCGNDARGLRKIIAEAAEQQLTEDQFANVIKQRTRALLCADQTTLPLAPVGLRRRAT